MARTTPLVAAGVSAVLLLGASCASREAPPITTAPTSTAAPATTGTAAPSATTGATGTSTSRATSTTSTNPASATSSSTASATVTSPSSAALPAPGSPCVLGSFPDCIDPDGDGQGTYLIGGADCLATFPTSPGLCSDLDGDGRAGYPDSG